MRIALYAPFKPLGHPTPSGDLTILTGLVEFLRGVGHVVEPASTFRSRWLSMRPALWPKAVFERFAAEQRARAARADLWLTYHTYWKSPDVIGPGCARALNLPYVIFQGIYSTKHGRDPRSMLGFWLNRRALKAADAVFTNKRQDHENLKRIVPGNRLIYAPPGIFPTGFSFDESARARLRGQWGAADTPLILATAMFRDDVKTQGLTFLMQALAPLARDGQAFALTLAGDGPTRPRLEALANELLPGRVRFLGRVPREELHAVYSACDLFAFPGIRESLGMVYLEAQSCGLPVVAFDGWGIPEVVLSGETGLLTPSFDHAAFAAAVKALLDAPERRKAMGEAARKRVREVHDLNRNYRVVDEILQAVRSGRPPRR